MLTWDQLHQKLEQLANRHSQLDEKFQAFAKFVELKVTSNNFHIKGISASLHLEQGYFTTGFAGRTLHFNFSSTLSENGTLVGVVTCNILKGFEEKSFDQVGKFTFTPNGQTNLKEPEDGDQIIIDSDDPALYVALHFMYESLLIK